MISSYLPDVFDKAYTYINLLSINQHMSDLRFTCFLPSVKINLMMDILGNLPVFLFLRCEQTINRFACL